MEELNEINEELNNEEEITNSEELAEIDLPDVYKKQANTEGDYQDEEGNRYDILICKITESKEYQQVGTEIIIDEEGHEIEVPVYDWVVVINKGWDSFDSLEQAMEAYGLTPYVEPEENKE